MKYGIFKRTASTSSGVVVVSFISLQNPTDHKRPAVIDAENAPAAANKAANLLKMLGVVTHTIDGNPDTIMSEFPIYFVGKFELDLADRYDTESLMYQIESFTPVPKD